MYLPSFLFFLPTTTKQEQQRPVVLFNKTTATPTTSYYSSSTYTSQNENNIYRDDAPRLDDDVASRPPPPTRAWPLLTPKQALTAAWWRSVTQSQPTTEEDHRHHLLATMDPLWSSSTSSRTARGSHKRYRRRYALAPAERARDASLEDLAPQEEGGPDSGPGGPQRRQGKGKDDGKGKGTTVAPPPAAVPGVTTPLAGTTTTSLSTSIVSTTPPPPPPPTTTSSTSLTTFSTSTTTPPTTLLTITSSSSLSSLSSSSLTTSLSSATSTATVISTTTLQTTPTQATTSAFVSTVPPTTVIISSILSSSSTSSSSTSVYISTPLGSGTPSQAAPSSSSSATAGQVRLSAGAIAGLTIGVVSMFLILVGGICICSRQARQKFLRPVTSRWTRLSYATGLNSPQEAAARSAGISGGDAHKSLVQEASPMGSNNNITTTANMTAANTIIASSPQQQASQRSIERPVSRDTNRVSIAQSTVSAASSEGGATVRQFPITKTFGRASWMNRSWYGRSWHGKSWHASQTFAPPMVKLPDPPMPPPAAKYSVFPTTRAISGVSTTSFGAESSIYAGESSRGGQTGTTSFYGTGLRPAPSPGSSQSSGAVAVTGTGGGQAGQMDVPQVVIYSPTPRVSAQTPVIVDADYSVASGAHSREASQGSMHDEDSEGSPAGSSSVEVRDGSNETQSSDNFSRPRDTLVEVTDIPRPLATAAKNGGNYNNNTTAAANQQQTLSRFSQVSDLSSASANTGYSWDDGASELYTADRASTLSRIAGGFGLSIVAERNYPPAARARPGDGPSGTPGRAR